MTEAIGPMELIVLGFEGNNFTGEITPALLDLVDRGIVRIVDLAIVIKKADGETMILEMQDLSEAVAAAMVRLAGEISGLMSEADLLELAEDMLPDSTVAVFLCEHLWATRFAAAVRSAGGTLVMSERIPGDVGTRRPAGARRRLVQCGARLHVCHWLHSITVMPYGSLPNRGCDTRPNAPTRATRAG